MKLGLKSFIAETYHSVRSPLSHDRKMCWAYLIIFASTVFISDIRTLTIFSLEGFISIGSPMGVVIMFFIYRFSHRVVVYRNGEVILTDRDARQRASDQTDVLDAKITKDEI